MIESAEDSQEQWYPIELLPIDTSFLEVSFAAEDRLAVVATVDDVVDQSIGDGRKGRGMRKSSPEGMSQSIFTDLNPG